MPLPYRRSDSDIPPRGKLFRDDVILVLSVGLASGIVIALVLLLGGLWSSDKPEPRPQPSRKIAAPAPAQTTDSSALQAPPKTPPPELVAAPVVTAPPPERRPRRHPGRPATGFAPVEYGAPRGNSELLIDNGNVVDGFVRVISQSEIPVPIRGFYVRAGESFVLGDIPPGDYAVRIAYGEEWDMVLKRFTSKQSYSGSQTFHVEDYSRTVIILQKKGIGNFRTFDITEDEFWR